MRDLGAAGMIMMGVLLGLLPPELDTPLGDLGVVPPLPPGVVILPPEVGPPGLTFGPPAPEQAVE